MKMEMERLLELYWENSDVIFIDPELGVVGIHICLLCKFRRSNGWNIRVFQLFLS
jgi:hypothetical protein